MLGYHELHRAGRRGWWRPVVGILLMAVMMVLVVPFFLQAALLVALVLRGESDPLASPCD